MQSPFSKYFIGKKTQSKKHKKLIVFYVFIYKFSNNLLGFLYNNNDEK